MMAWYTSLIIIGVCFVLLWLVCKWMGNEMAKGYDPDRKTIMKIYMEQFEDDED